MAVWWLAVLVAQLCLLRCGASCPEICHCEKRQGRYSDLTFSAALECGEVGLTDLGSLRLDAPVLYLNATGNNLTALSNSSFSSPHFATLLQLVLAKNKIAVVELGSLRGLTRLSDINLSHNDLSRVDRDVFSSNSKLFVLSLAGNPIVLPNEGWDIPSLTFLDLSSCGLETIPLLFFSSTPNIKYLHLTDNHLSYIDPLALRPIVRSLEALFLSGNQFTRFQDDLLQDLSSCSHLELADNPFHCDCELQRAYTLHTTRRPSHRQRLVCASPETMRGAPADHIQDVFKCNGSLAMTNIELLLQNLEG